MAAQRSTTLRSLSDSGDYCNTALKLYNRRSRRTEKIYEWMDQNLPAFGSSIGATVPMDGSLKVLSVGAGDGVLDCRVLTHLRDHMKPRIHAVILEPDADMMQQYQDLVSKESAKLQGVDFEWLPQTFQQYRNSSKLDDKFHFISSLSSIHHLGDIDESIKYMYEKLDSGGLLLITLMAGGGGLERMWQCFHEKFGERDDYFTPSDVKEACKRQNIPISDIMTIEIYSNISCCFDPPHQLSPEGSTLLDFLTYTVSFAQNAPAECRDDVLELLRSEACSERGPAGEVVFNGSNDAVVIRRH